MKNTIKIIFTLVMVFISNQLSAQPGGNNVPIPVACTSYTPNPELNKFLGTWKWTSGNDSFEMVLKKEKIQDIMDENACEDIIYGFHEYKKNGIVIESSLPFQNMSYEQQKNSISSWSIVINAIELRGGMYNISKGNNHIKFKFELIDNNHLEIKALENYEGVKAYPPGVPIPSSDINLPVGIILLKQ